MYQNCGFQLVFGVGTVVLVLVSYTRKETTWGLREAFCICSGVCLYTRVNSETSGTPGKVGTACQLGEENAGAPWVLPGKAFTQA